jgi:hypothetical protein
VPHNGNDRFVNGAAIAYNLSGMSAVGTSLPNCTNSFAGLSATAHWPIADIWARLLRRIKFAPVSWTPAYLPITDIFKAKIWNSGSGSCRPISDVRYIAKGQT